MLVQFKVNTQKSLNDLKINLAKKNQIIILEKSSKSKFQGEVIIEDDEKIQYIFGNTIIVEREIKYEKDSFIILNDTLEKLKIVQGIKEITFVLGKLTLWPYVPFVCGSISELGNWCPENAQMMILDGDKWYLTISVSRSFEYKFILNKVLGNEVEWEQTPNKKYDILTSPECVEIECQWEEQTKSRRLKRNPKFVHISIHYKTTSQRDRLVIVGNTAQLGLWNPQYGKALQRYLDYNWSVGLIVDENDLEFKFVIVSGEQCIWEDGQNRVLELEDRQSYSIGIIYQNLVAFWNFQNKSRINSREYDIDCPICSQHLKDSTIRIGQLCGHLICSKCYQQMSSIPYIRVKCPICRKPFQI